MQNKILQGSEEWKEIKQSKIGGSEIYSLAYHYCRPELQDLGFTNEQLAKDRPFRTVQELFLKVHFDAKLDEIQPVHQVFGNAMEEYIARRLEKEMPQVEIERTKDFVCNDDLASCSPDGYAIIKADSHFPDYDQKHKIDKSWGVGMVELKTANFFSKFSQGGSRLQYIFQNQHNMMICGDLKFGILTALSPKEKEVEIEGVAFPADDDFVKGRSYMWAAEGKFDLLDQIYDLQNYSYPALPKYQAMIKKALACFQRDLDAYKAGDQNAFPRNSEDIAGLQREKKMWGQLWPDHYGKKQLEEAEDLNKLFNERYQAQVEVMFAEQTFDKLTNEIYQKVKASGFDKFTDIIGTEHRMSWIKNGQTRFYKNKGVA